MIMRILKWILAVPLIIGAVLFALAHPQAVSITWSPFQDPVELPLYFVSLCFLGAGFLIGALMAWVGMGQIRAERRALKKEVKQLKRDVNEANEKIMETLSKYQPVGAIENKITGNDDE